MSVLLLTLALPWIKPDVVSAPQTQAPVCVEYCTQGEN
jgi:hypothetical protein